MSKHVAIYTRISQDRQHEELATERQEESCREFCRSRDWEVVDVYSDVDISAYKRDVERPGYEQLLKDIESGKVRGVVVWKLDRLVRRITEFSRFWHICETSKAFVTSATQPFDTSSPIGLALVFMLVGLAEEESKTRSDRLRAKHEQMAKQGKGKGGGTRPFGFTADRKTHDKGEALLVREAARRVLKGDSLRGIAKDWTDRGVSTVTGKPWSTSVLRNMLMGPRIAGLREHLGEIQLDDSNEPVRAEWKPILDHKTYFEVRRILDDPARNKRGRPGRAYLLTRGLAYCGRCNEKLVSRPRGDGQPCYVCATGVNFHGCGKIRRLAHPLEELVIARLYNVLDLIEEAATPRPITGDDQEQLTQRLKEDQLSLEQLSRDHYVDRLISRDEFLAARKPLEDRIGETGKRLLDLERTAPPTFADLVGMATKPDLDDPAQIDAWRKVAEMALEKVIIHPALKGRNTFDPERVELVWRPEVDELIWQREIEQRTA